MKITNNGAHNSASGLQNTEAAKGSVKTGTVATEQSVQKSKTSMAAGLNDSAKVELSSRAQDIKKAKELATPNAGIDEAKVARLQAMIDKGEYKVDAQAIADRLVDDHLLLPS